MKEENAVSRSFGLIKMLLPLAYTTDVMMMFVSLIIWRAHCIVDRRHVTRNHVSVMLAAHLSMATVIISEVYELKYHSHVLTTVTNKSW